jgi:hypothetical protein
MTICIRVEVFPLPLGEGQGEGVSSKPKCRDYFNSVPLPSPLPKGEGVFQETG